MRSDLKTVLVVDGGGRCAVLVDKYLTSKHVGKVLAVPGNDLIQDASSRVKIFPHFKTTDYQNILKICNMEKVDLIDVAQDDAIAAGVVNELIEAGFNVMGPTKEAGQIEWDKAWAREFMKKNNIPYPTFKICNSEKEGINFLKSQVERQWYIKASGLAAGKGALYSENNQEAISNILKMKVFGDSGKTYLIEEYLHGEEFSSFAIVDQNDFLIVGHAQDHKTVYDGNLGPNTGGMGCSSPPMVVTKNIKNQIELIFKKTVEGLVKTKRPYRGILYLGGVIDKNGKVYVIEFNARWGDPEAQVIVPSIKNDFYELALAAIGGKLNKIRIKIDGKYRVVITAASRGYPGDYSRVIGKQIFGLDHLLNHPASFLRHPERSEGSIKVFGAGVKKSNGKYSASGGRLFYVMSGAKNVAEARKMAYNALSLVYVEGNNLHYRTDIGYRDFERFYADRKTKSPTY